MEQLSDATQRRLKLYPMLFTTHSLCESISAFYSPPQTTAKKEKVSVQGIAAQFIYNAICGDLTIGGNSAEIVPLMKTN